MYFSCKDVPLNHPHSMQWRCYITGRNISSWKVANLLGFINIKVFDIFHCPFFKSIKKHKRILDIFVQISAQIYGKLIPEKSACWQGPLSLFTKSDSENFKTVWSRPALNRRHNRKKKFAHEEGPVFYNQSQVAWKYKHENQHIGDTGHLNRNFDIKNL